jgi:hypothetical protein
VRVVVAAIALLVGLLLASPAAAITREQANAVALETLKPQTLTSPVVLYGLPARVPASAVVSEFAKRGKLKGPGKAVWLFWEDLDPGAMFQHSSRLLLVDDRTGSVTKNVSMTYYPLVNGNTPPFLRTVDGYNSDTYQVFSGTGAASPRMDALVALREEPEPTASAPARAPLDLPPGSMQGDCLLMVVMTPAPVNGNPASTKQNQMEASNLKAAMNAWNGVATSVGIPAYVATATGPRKVDPGDKLAPPPFDKQVTGKSLKEDVKKLVDDENCTDIVLYLFGHGNPPPGWVDPLTNQATKGGGVQLLMGAKSPEKPGGKPSFKVLTGEDVASAIVLQDDRASFKVVVEACFAERFDAVLLHLPQVKLLMGSSSPELPSLFNVSKTKAFKDKLKPAVPNPDKPEFTHGVTEGFKQTLANDAEVQSLYEMGDSLLARLLKAAFEKERPNDSGALNDKTQPSVHDNLTTTSRVDSCGTWRHNGPGDSDLLLYIATTPPVPGGQFSYRVTAGITRVVANGTGQGMLDSVGKASWAIPINDYGRFEVEVTVKSPDGSQIISVEVIEVIVAAGAGPSCSAIG